MFEVRHKYQLNKMLKFFGIAKSTYFYNIEHINKIDKVVDNNNISTYYKRNFFTTSVNQIWSTDVSEFHIASGKLYLSPILDAHNREIISYTISKSPNYKQISDMLNQAFENHKNLDDLIFHSD